MTAAPPAPFAPRWLDPSRLSLTRRLGVLAGGAVLLAVWGREVARAPRDVAMLSVLVAPIAASLVLSSLNHAGAQLASRGIWWAQLLLGTVVALGGRDREPAALALGAGLALLSAGAAGLEPGAPSRGPFEPVAFRRSLMVSIAMATAEVQLLATGSGILAHEHNGTFAAAAGACAAALALGAYGVFRLKLWGVLVHLLAMLGVATLVAAALRNAPEINPVLVWVGTVSLQILLPMPMLLAIIRRSPVRPSSPSPWPGRLFYGLVAAMMASSAGAVLVR